MSDPAPPPDAVPLDTQELPGELYLNVHVLVDLRGGREQVTAHVAVDAQGHPVADPGMAAELLRAVLPALQRHADDAPSARAQRERDAVASGPLPITGVAPETVLITTMWTGDPEDLDDALAVLHYALRTVVTARAAAAMGVDVLRAGVALALAHQLLEGALGEEGELDEEPHEHLTVVRHQLGPVAPPIVPRGGPADGGEGGWT